MTGKSRQSLEEADAEVQIISGNNKYQAVKEIKSNHANEHAKRTGKTDDCPRYMSPTLASLQKRESFRRPNFQYHKRNTRRTQSETPVSVGKRLSKVEEEMIRNNSALDVAIGEDDSSDDTKSMNEFVIDNGQSPDIDIEKMREDVQSAYESIPQDRTLRRNSTGSSPNVKGGLSPLPRCDSAEEPGDMDYFRAGPEEPMPSFRHAEEINSGEVEELDDQPPQVMGMEVEVPESHPSLTLTQHSESFDSTAAQLNSPPVRSISPILREDVNMTRNKSKRNLDQTVPETEEQKESSDDAESSEDPRRKAEARCQPGAVLNGSPPSGGYVQINRVRAAARPNNRERPNLKGSFTLAGIFAGVAIIVGILFSGSSARK